MRCWLCEYAGSPDALRAAKFCMDQSGTMGPLQMSQILQETLEAVAPGEVGTSQADILAHISGHSLQPALRVAHILRTLLDLLDKLGDTLTGADPDGNTVVDGRNVQVYLKVVDEVKSLYAIGDTSKLLFANAEQIRAAVPDASELKVTSKKRKQAEQA